MNTRTRTLLIAMGAMVVLWLGDSGYRNLIEGPAAERERELDRVDRQINEARDKIIETADAADQLETLERLSLPYDPELARAGYQDWLLDLVQQSELAGASVDAGQPSAVKIKDRDTGKPKQIYLRYTFSLRGRGRLQQITDFLYRFYQGGHLHKINSLSLNPVSGGRLVDLTASIEAIGLTRCERKAELSREIVSRLDADAFSDYQSIARRNLFARYGDATLANTVVSAITIGSGGTLEAWLSTGSGETLVLARDATVQVDAHTIEVVDVLQGQVLLDVDGRVIAVETGQSVQEAEEGEAPEAE